jgi:cell wall-associated NlpC family hydrolase
VKNLFILFLLIATAGCKTSRPAESGREDQDRSNSLEFIDNISIQPRSQTGTGNSPSGSQISQAGRASGDHVSSTNIEGYSPLQFKYAILTNAAVEDMANLRLLNYIEEWYGTPYHYGGNSRDGIDCSAFVSSLMSEVYDVNNLPRMSRDQYAATKRVHREDLRQGDLVFFHTQGRRKTVSHVGIYLLNNKFIHASISGVMISDMGEGYYFTHYIGAGRIRN